MSTPNPDSWDRIFEQVGKTPGSTKQQPAKKTVQALQDEAERSRRRYAADVAVSMGAVDTGEDFDPYEAINEQYNAGGQSAIDLKREQDSIAAGLAQLNADVKANNNSGKSLVVPISDYGTDMPSVFDVFADTGSGTIYNDGNTLQMPNASGRELLAYNVEPLATNHFEVSLVVPEQSGRTFGSYGSRYLYFIGRRDATSENYCVARLNGNKLRVGAVLGGDYENPTWFGFGATGSGPTEVTITPGVYMTFQGGVFADERLFQFKVNNQVRATFNDTGDVSMLGEDYRWTGCGIRNDSDPLSNQSPSISHFMANDNAPAPIVGSYASMCRLSSSQVSVFLGEFRMPNNFYDLVQEVSADITVDLTEGSFTVSKAGRYTLTAGLRCGGSWPNHFKLVAFVNGLARRSMSADFGFTSSALGGTQLPDQVHGVCPLYLEVGDVVEVGYNSDGGTPNAMRGTSSGNHTWATLDGVG